MYPWNFLLGYDFQTHIHTQEHTCTCMHMHISLFQHNKMHEVYLNSEYTLSLWTNQLTSIAMSPFNLFQPLLIQLSFYVRLLINLKKSLSNFFQHPLFTSSSIYLSIVYSAFLFLLPFPFFVDFVSFFLFTFSFCYFLFLFSLNIPLCLLFIFISIIILTTIIPSYPPLFFSYLNCTSLTIGSKYLSYKSFKCFYFQHHLLRT